jgi:hypothetical protein
MAKMRNDINNEDGQQRLSPEISDRNGQETINGGQNMVIVEQL